MARFDNKPIMSIKKGIGMHKNAPCFIGSIGRVEALFLRLVWAATLCCSVEVQAQEAPSVNVALGKEAYMVRLQDNLPPASYGNDDNFSTAVRSTSRTVDAYWEVDLGKIYTLDKMSIHHLEQYSLPIVVLVSVSSDIKTVKAVALLQSHEEIMSVDLGGMEGRFVAIQSQRKTILSFAEVEVFRRD